MPTEVDEEALSWMDVNQDEAVNEQSDVNADSKHDEEAEGKIDAAESEDKKFDGSILEKTENSEELRVIGDVPDGTRSSTDEKQDGDDENEGEVHEQGEVGEAFAAEPLPDRVLVFPPSGDDIISSQNPTGTTFANAAPTSPSLNYVPSSSGGTPALFASGNALAKIARIRAGRYSGRNSATLNASIDEKYPHDNYSFIALHGPQNNFVFFVFGLLPFLFQMIFLLLLVWSETDELRGTIGETDNPDSGNTGTMAELASFIPANASPIIRMTQVTAIAAYVLFPDSSLKDIVRSVQTFPLPSRVKKGDQVWKTRLACILRGIQGALAMFVTLLLVMTSDAVVDIILNFTAVNFISTLDDYAFSLALAGEFGPALQFESEAITKTDLPSCMKRKKGVKHWYNLVLSSLVCVVLFGMMTFVFLSQNSSMVWVTRTFRVQFQEKTGLKGYSGCFEINDNPNSISFKRRSYTSLDNGGNASFAYCRKHRQWILLDSSEGNSDPCIARDDNEELSRSSKTDTFDIRTSFDSQWVSATNTPLDMYFFESGDKDNLFCELTLGDGVCNDQLNKLGFGYDEGDCCSATCEGANCGRKPDTVFGVSSSSFNDFPSCRNPDMVPITIRVDGIKSSRDEEFAPSTFVINSAQTVSDRPFSFNDPIGESQWRNATPVNPYLVLDCGEKNVLFTYIEESMVNKYHTVKVADGANCTVEVQNTTSNEYIGTDEPIWFVNYTLFHGETTETEPENQVEILSQQSSRQEKAYFKRIPECYFADLEDYDYVDTPYIYTALDWVTVLEDTFDKDTSECGERFALFDMAFAMNGTDMITKTQNQCRWPEIVCSDERVTSMDWSYKDLNGDIPNELILLENLEVLKMNGNRISSVPNKVGTMQKLRDIDLSFNDLSYIPTEIGSLTSVRTLRLDDNQLSSIPSEIGKLTDLQELNFGANDFTSDPYPPATGSSVPSATSNPSAEFVHSAFSIPAEIWQLTNLQTFRFHENELSSLPTEIGQLTSLQILDLYTNELSSIPTEIGRLTNLTSIRLDENFISSLPKEISQLKSLQKIDLYANNLSTFPTDVTKLSNLVDLFMHRNKISSIPTEIGLLTSLQNLLFGQNRISSIPTEIEYLASLRILFLDGNDLESIPTEIGKLSNLTYLNLSRNNLLAIPSEIGELSRLEKLMIDTNQLASIPTEIGQLKKLQNLHLVSNMLSFIPTEIQHLTNLQILDLYGNALTKIPTEIGQLANLQNLRLYDNQLTSIPTIIGQLTSLQNLQLNDNQLSIIPEEIGQLANLEKLAIDGNKLQSIPRGIGQLTRLQVLYADRNQLSSVPTDMWRLTNLQDLNLGENQFISIATDIGKLTNLKDLDLGENQLSSIPTELGDLKNLRSLYLNRNKLKTVPSEIGQLTSLERLYLDNNEIASLPSEIGLLTNLRRFYYGGSNITSDDFPQELVALCSAISCRG